MELDGLLEEIQEQVESEGQASEDSVARFQHFREAHGEKVDRIGGFVRFMEAREQYCRSESARLGDRARAIAGKVDRTKNMVLYYLLSRVVASATDDQRSNAKAATQKIRVRGTFPLPFTMIAVRAAIA